MHLTNGRWKNTTEKKMDKRRKKTKNRERNKKGGNDEKWDKKYVRKKRNKYICTKHEPGGKREER